MVHFRGLGPDEPYWSALSEGRLALPRCRSCGTWHWPAVSRCGICGSWQQEWHNVPLEGRVFTWTRTWHAFQGAEGLHAPFVTVLVELPRTGGRRVLGLYDGDEPKIGTNVVGTVRGTTVSGGSLPALHWRLA
jgi:uncharacterized OB-fold protein